MFLSCKMNKIKDWLTDEPIWSRFQSDSEKNELQRILAKLDGCNVGIGKDGVYRLSYSFAAEVLRYAKNIHFLLHIFQFIL